MVVWDDLQIAEQKRGVSEDEKSKSRQRKHLGSRIAFLDLLGSIFSFVFTSFTMFITFELVFILIAMVVV